MRKFRYLVNETNKSTETRDDSLNYTKLPGSIFGAFTKPEEKDRLIPGIETAQRCNIVEIMNKIKTKI